MVEVKEKLVISENATVGAYFWSRGRDYIKMADCMIAKNIRVNNEVLVCLQPSTRLIIACAQFYVAPVYNEGIENGMQFHLSFCEKMYGLGVPADLTNFLYEYVRPRRSAGFLVQNDIVTAETRIQLPVRLIAHRGNTHGVNPGRENHPSYVTEALQRGFDVEIDVWYCRPQSEWYLGHDSPLHKVPYEFLLNNRLWLHCKNMEAIQILASESRANCFFHNVDDCTLTSHGFVWTYPDKELCGPRSVAVMFSNPEHLISSKVPLYGICADNVNALYELMVVQRSDSMGSVARGMHVLDHVWSGASKAIIFDLDGVLVESKDIHYEALNTALHHVAGPKYVISRQEHELVFDGLSTNQKLGLLSRMKGLPEQMHQAVFIEKQELTLELFRQGVQPNQEIIETLSALKELGFAIAVASNCIRASVIALLDALRVLDYVDAFFSNEDVKNPKPSPDIYLKAASAFGCKPREVVIVEDSIKGFEAAVRAGGNLCRVRSPQDVRLSHLLKFISEVENQPKPHLTIVTPLAKLTQQYWLDGPDSLPVEVPLQLADVDGFPLVKLMCDSFVTQVTRKAAYCS